MAIPSFLFFHNHHTTTAGGKLPHKRKQTENDQRSSFRLFLRLGFGRLSGLECCDGELIRLDGLLQIPEAPLDVPVDGIGGPFDVAQKAALIVRAPFRIALAHLVEMKGGGVKAEFLRRHIGRAVGLGRIRLPVVTAAHHIEAGVGLLTGNGADGCGFIHPVSDKNGALFRHILRLHPLGKLIGDGKRNRAVFYHGGDDFLRQMLLGRQGLGASGLRNIVGFCDGITIRYGTVLFGVFLIGKEGVSFLAGTDGAAGFLPFIEGAGVGDFSVLLIQNEQIPGALGRAVRHEIEKAFHGFVILEHRLGLRVDSCPGILPFGLLQGGVFFLGVLLFRLRLGFLLFAD